MSEHTTLTEAEREALRNRPRELNVSLDDRALELVVAGIKADAYAAGLTAARVSTATGDTEEGLTLTVRAGSEPVSALGVVEEFRAHEPFWQDKMTGEPCPRRGNVLCTVTDSGHRHIACHMVSTATGDTAGDDLRDRVTAWLATKVDSLGGPLYLVQRHELEAILAASSPAPVVSRPETTDHDCATCADCIHDGHKCCGCYDGACCRAVSLAADPEAGERDG